MPRAQRRSGVMAVMSSPPSVNRPSLGGKAPAMMLKSVVLPAPFGPMMPWIRRSSNWSET